MDFLLGKLVVHKYHAYTCYRKILVWSSWRSTARLGPAEKTNTAGFTGYGPSSLLPAHTYPKHRLHRRHLGGCTRYHSPHCIT
jgi:hypothetical protein